MKTKDCIKRYLKNDLYEIELIYMPVNQMETQLEAITTTIAYLERKDSCDPEVLEELKKERNRLLRELNVHQK